MRIIVEFGTSTNFFTQHIINHSKSLCKYNIVLGISLEV